MRCDRCHGREAELQHVAMATMNDENQAVAAILECEIVDVCEACSAELVEQWNTLVDVFLADAAKAVEPVRRAYTGEY